MDAASSIVSDASGNIYIAGYFESLKINFDFTTLTNVGSHDIFLAKLSRFGVRTTQSDVNCNGGNDGSATVY